MLAMSRAVALEVPISWGTDAATAFALEAAHTALAHESADVRAFGEQMARRILELWDQNRLSIAQRDLEALRAVL